MCRTRINKGAICSSENYGLSKKLHRDYLRETHEDRVKEIKNMQITISNPRVTHNHQRPYIIVFGHKIILNQEDAFHASRAGMKIYYE